MAKGKAIKDWSFEDDINFSELENMMDFSCEADAMRGMASSLIEASTQQMALALELTKLVVEKSAASLSEENILTTFKRATKTVTDNYPLKPLWDKLT